MWIKRSRIEALEKKVADLEKNQLQTTDMVKRYIEDSESLSNQLSEQIKELPQTLEGLLCDYSSNK